MLKSYASNFTKGNIEEAKAIIEHKNIELRRKDAILLALFTGTLIITFIVLLSAILIPPDNTG